MTRTSRTITIVDYGMGNLGSIANMIKKVGGEVIITSVPEEILLGKKLILPGVGAFDNGMKNLRERHLLPALEQRVVRDGVPILGLCLGLQLFTRGSEEGTEPGLGWIDARTVRFNFDAEGRGLKIPHMGWNQANLAQPSELFADIPTDSRFYFVHSFHLAGAHSESVLTTTRHGYDFTSGAVHGNIMGLQFHPEKSHRFGKQIFRNFMERF
jgi:glutamine amidotransferase